MEGVVACGIMAAAMVTTTMFHSRITTNRRTVQTAMLARMAVLNARETIGSWPSDEITRERIEQLELPTELHSRLAEPQWIVQLTDVSEPIEGKRIFIDLHWQRDGQTHSTSGITFWVSDAHAKDDAAESRANNDASESQL